MSATEKAKFITIEGIEGAGKSTAIKFIADWLSKKNIPHIVTREPGGTEIAEAIRGLFLAHHEEKMCADTEILLMFASRAQHLASLIMPALQRGDWVLCDRFTDATFAYQGGGRGIESSRIAQMEQWVQNNLRPDHVFVLDLPPAMGMQRIHARAVSDRIEKEKLAFFERVRAVYLERARQDPERYSVIDASVGLEEVEAQIAKVLKSIWQS